jgi:hypothetical protein
MLDPLKVSLVLTVQVGLRASRPSVAEGLPAPLVFEWELGGARLLAGAVSSLVMSGGVQAAIG